MIKRFGKLVRDKIPELIRKKGAIPNFRFMRDDEYKRELVYKLVDVAEELRRATYFEKDKKGIQSKCADLMEVYKKIIKTFNLDESEIEKTRQLKIAQKGGFNAKIFLESVEYKKYDIDLFSMID